MGSALFCWLVKANILASISVANVAPEKTAHIAGAINWWSAKMFPVFVAVGVLIALRDIYRIYRVRSNAGQGVMLSAVTGVH
jgi:hypothetical protein